MICIECRQRLSNVKETCAICANSYEFFLNYVPKEVKKETFTESDDAEFVNFEILDEALDEPEELKEIKREVFLEEDSIKIESKVTDTGQVVPASEKMVKLVKVVKQKVKKKPEMRQVIFCKTPKRKDFLEIKKVSMAETKSRKKPSFPLTYYYCCKCTEVVFSSEKAESHFIKNHPSCERNDSESNPKGFDCKFCLNYFNTTQELKDHRTNLSMQVNADSFLYTCSLCQQSGFTLADYKAHGETQHGSEAIYSCSLCPITYKNVSSFTSHVYVKHKNEQNNVCAECGKCFARKSYLESHYRVDHQGRRDYHCKLCTATFKRSGNLKSHMRVHTGE